MEFWDDQAILFKWPLDMIFSGGDFNGYLCNALRWIDTLISNFERGTMDGWLIVIIPQGAYDKMITVMMGALVNLKSKFLKMQIGFILDRID